MKRAVSPDSPGDDPMLLGPGSMRSETPAAEEDESFSLLDVTLPPSSARSSRSFSLAKSRSPSLLRDQAPPSNMSSSGSPGWSLPVPSPRPGPIARARASRSVSFAPEESEKTPTRPAPVSTPYEISMDFAADGFDSDSDGEVAAGADDTFVHLRRDQEVETTPVPEVGIAAEDQDLREESIEVAVMESRAVDLADESHEDSMLGDQSMLADDTYDDIWEDIEDAQGQVSPARVSAPTLPEAPLEGDMRQPSVELEQSPTSPPRQQEEQLLIMDDIELEQSQLSAPIEEEQQPLRQVTPVPTLEIRHPSPSILSPPASSPQPQQQSSHQLSLQLSPRPWMRAITPRLSTPVHDLLSPPATASTTTSRFSRSPSRRTQTPAPATEELSQLRASPALRESRTPTPGPSVMRDTSTTPAPTPRTAPPERGTPVSEPAVLQESTPARALSDMVDAVAKLHVDHEQREQKGGDHPQLVHLEVDCLDSGRQARSRSRSVLQHSTTPRPVQGALLDSARALTPVSCVATSPARVERDRSQSRSVRPASPASCKEQSLERTPVRPSSSPEPQRVSPQATPVEKTLVLNLTTTPQYSPTAQVAGSSPSRQRSPSWPVVESDHEQDEELEGDVTVEADPADWAEEQEEDRGGSPSSELSDGEESSDEEEAPAQPQDADRIVVRLVECTVKIETPEPEARPAPAEENTSPELSHEAETLDNLAESAAAESTTPQNSPPLKQSELPAEVEPPVFRFTEGSGGVAGLESLLRRRSQGGSFASSRSPHIRSPPLVRQVRSTPERSTPVAPPLPPRSQPRSLLEELQFSGEGHDDEMSSEPSDDDEPLQGSVVEVSSMDPRAAARAAAILKLVSIDFRA